MKRSLTVISAFIFLTLICFPDSSRAGTITGSVKVKGLRSPANILVFLNKAPAGSMDFSKAKFVMDQRNLEFIPHVLPIMVGATVHFPNNDQVSHNVFSMSRTKEFNLGSYKGGESPTVQFDKPGIIELRCDVHAEMAAYILVMKNPYFGVTDKDGRFQIPDPNYLKQAGLDGVKALPAGNYSVKTWHEKLKTKKQAIVVPDTGSLDVQFELSRGVPGVLYK